LAGESLSQIAVANRQRCQLGERQKQRRMTTFWPSLRSEMVDKNGGQRLYTLSSARRRLGAMARLRSPSLFTRWPSIRPCSRGHVRAAASKGGLLRANISRAGDDGLQSDGLQSQARCGSGCLTGESEERETWTAESLRAACRAKETLRARRPGRDFGGRRFRSTLGCL